MKTSKIIKKLLILFFGLLLYSIAIVLTIHSQLGASPWEVFHLGLANHTVLTIGQASQITGLVVIFIGIFLGEIPGAGSLLNMYFIGYFTDLIRQYQLIPYANQWWLQFPMLLLGIYLMGWATYFYLGVGLGAGPRDSLMVGLIKKLKCSLWIVRGLIEGSVLLIGYLLGGLVGIGTVLMTLAIGLAIEHVFKIMKKDASAIRHFTLVDHYNHFRAHLQLKKKTRSSDSPNCR